MVVSPTYFGACADVAALAAVAHEHGVPLAVDEAWGAHLRFHPDLPPDALGQGADLVVSSTHKIVGSLTQAAMLHLGAGELVDAAVVDRCVSLVETTSPSALLSGSLDAARRLARVHGEELLGETLAGDRRAPARRSRRSPAWRSSTTAWSAAPGSPAGTRCGWPIDVRGTGSSGYRLAKAAFDLDDGIDLELSAENVVVAIFGLGEPAAAAGERLVAALREAVERLGDDEAADAAGEADATAPLGRAGDDPARGLPRPPGGRPLRAG